MERLSYNYSVKRDINGLHNRTNLINPDNLQNFRFVYFDLKSKLEFVNFIVFNEIQKRHLMQKLESVRKKISEIEFEQEISQSKFRKSL